MFIQKKTLENSSPKKKKTYKIHPRHWKSVKTHKPTLKVPWTPQYVPHEFRQLQ